MERIARIMETFWLVLAILSAAGALYILIERGWATGKVWLLFPSVAFAMWGYRRFMRRKMAQWAERQRTEEQRDGR